MRNNWPIDKGLLQFNDDNKKNWKSVIYISVGAGIIIVYLVVQGYLYYFAPCSKVKSYWYVTQTPARCITP